MVSNVRLHLMTVNVLEYAMLKSDDTQLYALSLRALLLCWQQVKAAPDKYCIACG